MGDASLPISWQERHPDGPDAADDLLAFVDASPTPYHACAEVIRRLEAHGFRRLDERDGWSLAAGDRVYVLRGDTSLLAFVLGAEPPAAAGFRLVGAHTDSPNLRLKPRPALTRHGVHQVGVEPYGGVLLYTWLDRDLSIAGRVLVRDGAAVTAHLVRVDRPIARIPSLAIHLQRGVNTDGLVLNAQTHLPPLVGLESAGPLDLRELLAGALAARGIGARPEDVLGFDLALFDVVPSTRAGLRRELIHAPRLDNLASCHAATLALLADLSPRAATRGIVLYDHEEVGSQSAQGADSGFLRGVLERLTSTLGARAHGPCDHDAIHRALARSFCISADMAHAVHPNYADKHEPQHMPLLGRGPVVKSNVGQRYATDGEGWAHFERLCRLADVTPQYFVTRSDLACGTTIGPITAAQLGVRTVDVGNPMLSMHSIREQCAAADVDAMIRVLRALFEER
jgi:aspartyl aminopeptidase